MSYRKLTTMILALTAMAGLSACDILGSDSSSDEYGAAFAFMTDYQSAAIGTFDVGDSTVAVSSLSPVHTDVALRSEEGLVFVVERYGKDDIIVLDPENPGVPLANYSVGNNSNPQDIVLESTSRAYVMRLGMPNVLIINPMTGDSLGTIDLTILADADGLPELADAVLKDGKLYVLLQLLDQNAYFAATGPGQVAVIDTETDQVVRNIPLTIENPAEMVLAEDVIYVVGGGYYDTSTGGIDMIEANQQAAVRLISGDALGGRPGGVVYAEDSHMLWTHVSQTWPYGAVYGIDTQNGSIANTLSGLVSPATIAADGTRLLVGDADMDGAGLFVFDLSTGNLVQDKVDMALPPSSLIFVKD